MTVEAEDAKGLAISLMGFSLALEQDSELDKYLFGRRLLHFQEKTDIRILNPDTITAIVDIAAQHNEVTTTVIESLSS